MAEDRGARGSSSPVKLLIRIAVLLHAPSLSRARVLLAHKFAAAVSRCYSTDGTGKPFYGLSSGNRITSRIDCEIVSGMAKRRFPP